MTTGTLQNESEFVAIDTWTSDDDEFLDLMEAITDTLAESPEYVEIDIDDRKKKAQKKCGRPIKPTKEKPTNTSNSREPDRNNYKKKTESENSTKKLKITRRRIPNPGEWKANKRKLLRIKGEAYIDRYGQKVNKRSMKAGCESNCRLKCKEFFSDPFRQKLFENFWKLESFDCKRDFIKNHMEFAYKKTIAVKSAHTSRRELTYRYYFPNDANQKTRVCKTMFMDTLSISDQIIKTILKKLKDSNRLDIRQQN